MLLLPFRTLLVAGAALLLSLPAPAQPGRASGGSVVSCGSGGSGSSGSSGGSGGSGSSSGVASGEIVEGVVTRILPTAGFAPGTLVALLGGLVTVDLGGADVKRFGADGTPGTGGVVAGDRLVAVLKDPTTTGGRLVARKAFVYAEPEGAILRSDLDSVDATLGSFVLLGLKVQATPDTVFAGDGVQGLADLKKGDPVVATVQNADGTLEATRVLRTAPVPMPGERVRGRVMVIDTTSWTISPASSGPTIPEVIVGVTADTRIVGDPKIGDDVEILGHRDAAGRLVAVLVVRVPAAPAPESQRIHGWVDSIAADAWAIRIGPPGSMAPDILVRIDARTRIVGNPVPGDEVEILATKPASGAPTALLIVKAGTVTPMSR